jgi:CIC family chloride channel protein
MARALTAATSQLAFPVVDQAGVVLGAVSAASIASLIPESGMQMLAVAADIMQTEGKVGVSDHLGNVMELTQSTGLRQLPVVTSDGRLVGFLDESDVTRAYLDLLKTSVEKSRSGISKIPRA